MGRPLSHKTYHDHGKSFAIRKNFFQFLLARTADLRTLFWIDQICIDQLNIHEQNHQVSFMGMIYSHASEVII